MEIRCWRICLIAVAALLTASGAAETAPLSDRVVAYQIEGTYDARTHTLDANELLTYTNKTGTTLDRFPFHLYLNAFQPKSTWETESQWIGNRDLEKGAGWDDKHFGSNEVKSLEIVGEGDVTGKMKFISPDDGNADDRTVFEIVPPKPVAPGGSIQFRIHFVAKFPEVVARTGYKRDFLMAGQWFPKVGVWWNGSWNCHQFHASTEFFADFGTFDVKLTLPAKWNVGSTGLQTGAKDNGNGTQTVSFHAEDVHDFAWTTDPGTIVVEDSIKLSTRTVKIRMLMQPGHMASAPRYMEALKGTMRKFDEWIGPYPYPQITVVDPPHGGGAAGGMEYPTLIHGGRLHGGCRNPCWLPEMEVEHEFGHQYWYGMVATNEFENAWMDEGINSYTEAKIHGRALWQDNISYQFSPGHFERARLSAHELRADGRSRSAGASGVAVPGQQLLFGDFLWEDGVDDADAGEPDRRKDGDARAARLLRSLQVQASHARRVYRLHERRRWDRTWTGTGSRRSMEPRRWTTAF